MKKILYIMGQEFKRFKGDNIGKIMLFLIPTILAFFFGILYMHGKVTDVKIAVIDEDQTSLSRGLIDALDRSDKLDVMDISSDRSKINEYLDSNKANGVILIPHNFYKNVERNIPTQIGVFVDGTNILIANTVAAGANEVLQTEQAGILIKVLEGMNVSPAKATNLVQLVQYRSRYWYNPTFSYSTFLVTGLIGVGVQQVVMYQTSQSFIYDRLHGLDFTYFSSGIGFLTYFTAKSLFYWLIAIYNSMLSVLVIKNFFTVPIRGAFITLTILILLFSSAVVMIGFVFSLFARTEMAANQYAMILSSPAFLVSGFTWPTVAIPMILQWIADLIPLTHFVMAFRAIALRGASLQIVQPYLSNLLLLTVFFGIISLGVVAKRWHSFSKRGAKELLQDLQQEVKL